MQFTVFYAAVFSLCLPTNAASPPSNTRKVSYVDTFDKQTAIANGAASLVDGKEPGALNYSGFGYGMQNPAIVRPASLPNVIVSSATEQTLEGEPYFYPKNSSVTCFDLTRVCYACNVNTANNEAQSTQPCTIQFTGTPAYAGSSPPQAIEVLTYQGKGVGQNMTCQDFPTTFSCLRRVDTTVISALSGNSPVTNVLLLDNVTYNAYISR